MKVIVSRGKKGGKKERKREREKGREKEERERVIWKIAKKIGSRKIKTPSFPQH